MNYIFGGLFTATCYRWPIVGLAVLCLFAGYIWPQIADEADNLRQPLDFAQKISSSPTTLRNLARPASDQILGPMLPQAKINPQDHWVREQLGSVNHRIRAKLEGGAENFIKEVRSRFISEEQLGSIRDHIWATLEGGAKNFINEVH